ncbi:chromosome condensation regulator RCC1 repeat protein [Leptospira wolbachii serovar Codice str. CDC]|uniref:Chromosome condensation regulator RCC1 repeat protein n=1 Tax=Leptospira wolbachii serovar Codice str. CDC TaxID=1218599 RepID=R9A4L2_9LEPT|nr:chromosome condensation regulator RCC1 repeat protein [Leptospira wolbachii]EOQ95175.1 chromosome condensation regulator RCC1 repeat protein [Leptospira wolbachii serovar Codice str. CDC]
MNRNRKILKTFLLIVTVFGFLSLCKPKSEDTSGLALLGFVQNSSNLSGTLTDGAGNPIPNASLELEVAASFKSASSKALATTTETGTWQLPLGNGTFDISVKDNTGKLLGTFKIASSENLEPSIEDISHLTDTIFLVSLANQRDVGSKFEILSPKDGSIIKTYDLAVNVKTTDSLTCQVLQNKMEKQNFQVNKGESNPSISIKPLLGANKIQIHCKNESGVSAKKTILTYFGNRITAGGSHSGYVVNGSLYTWGRNNYGQLGSGTSTGDLTNPTITKLSTISNVSSIGFNQNNSLAITDDGSVWTWGANSSGQLGMGNTGDLQASTSDAGPRNPPRKVPGISGAVMGTYGYDHAVVLKSDGTVVTFGSNSVGQLGNGTGGAGTYSANPVTVTGLPTDIIQVIAGSEHTAALTKSGDVYVWGRDQYGNLGDGTLGTASEVNSTPKKVLSLSGIIHIANGRDHILALKSDGTVYSWGLAASGQLGTGGSGSPSPVATPTLVTGLYNVVSVWANGTQSFAILSDGTVKGWGANASGNLGTGLTTPAKLYTPGDIVVGVKDIQYFGCGALHNFAILKSGSLYGWGWNFKGSVGRSDLQETWAATTPIFLTIPK